MTAKTFGWYRGYLPDGEPVDEFVLGADRPADWPEGNGIPLCRATAEQAGKVEGIPVLKPDDGNGDDDAYNRGWNECRDFALAKPTQPAAPFDAGLIPPYEMDNWIAANTPPSREVEALAAPTERGWYWHHDGEVWRMLFVFPRPGHRYLAVQDDAHPVTGKRHFRMADKIGGRWVGPLETPTLAPVQEKAP